MPSTLNSNPYVTGNRQKFEEQLASSLHETVNTPSGNNLKIENAVRSNRSCQRQQQLKISLMQAKSHLALSKPKLKPQPSVSPGQTKLINSKTKEVSQSFKDYTKSQRKFLRKQQGIPRVTG